MRTRKRNMRQIVCLIIIVLIVFAFCSTFTFLSYDKSGDLLYISIMPDLFKDLYEELHSSKDQLNFIILNSSEAFIPTRLVEIKNRYVQNWNRSLYALCSTQISLLTCAALLVHGLLFLANKVNKHVSIIAIPIGGHAPPTLWA